MLINELLPVPALARNYFFISEIKNNIKMSKLRMLLPRMSSASGLIVPGGQAGQVGVSRRSSWTGRCPRRSGWTGRCFQEVKLDWQVFLGGQAGWEGVFSLSSWIGRCFQEVKLDRFVFQEIKLYRQVLEEVKLHRYVLQDVNLKSRCCRVSQIEGQLLVILYIQL